MDRKSHKRGGYINSLEKQQICSGRKERYIIAFYNAMQSCESGKVENIEQIPPEILHFMFHIDYTAMVTPFVVPFLKKGRSRLDAASTFGISQGEARGIREKFKIHPRKKTG